MEKPKETFLIHFSIARTRTPKVMREGGICNYYIHYVIIMET